MKRKRAPWRRVERHESGVSLAMDGRCTLVLECGHRLYGYASTRKAQCLECIDHEEGKP